MSKGVDLFHSDERLKTIMSMIGKPSFVNIEKQLLITYEPFRVRLFYESAKGTKPEDIYEYIKGVHVSRNLE